jgi:hypothetical protein
MSARAELASLQHSLNALRAGSLAITAFSQATRQHQALLAALPPRYAEVLLGLLDRLESSALFTDESCSFSHTDLHDSLQLWATKAAQQLPA